MMSVNNKIKCIDVDLSNKNHESILKRFYDDLYAVEFPNEDERETLNNIKTQYERMKNLKECEYHIIIALLDDEIVGGIIGDYFIECNSSVIEFVVTDKTKRNLHIGSSLIFNFIENCNKDATKHLNKSSIEYCFFETENPNKVDKELKDYCISRLHFWDKMNAKRLDINYIQMPLEKGKRPVDCLYLAVMIINENLHENFIDKVMVSRFLECYFWYAFNTDKKDSIKELEDLKRSILNEKKVELAKLI